MIQLKRFQYNSYSSRKLSNLISFPIEGLDLTRYLGQDHPLHKSVFLEIDNFKHSIEMDTSEASIFSESNSNPVSLSINEPQEGEFLQEEKEAQGDKVQVESSEQVDRNKGNSVEDEFESLKQNFMRELEEPGDNYGIYDLHGVVNHMGVMGGGHYVSYVKNSFDGSWLCFNDQEVRELDQSQVETRFAYLLFYVRKGANRDLSSYFSLRTPTNERIPEQNDQCSIL